MTDIDKLALLFARCSFTITDVFRITIQPSSLLSDFKTKNYGFLFVVRGEARFCVNESAMYMLHAGSVFHAAPGMTLDAQVIGGSEFEYYTVFYTMDDRKEPPGADSACELDVHFKLEPGVRPEEAEMLSVLHQQYRATEGITTLQVKSLLLQLLYQVLLRSRQRDSASGASHRSSIEDAVAYIHGHYMKPLTLDELAELHGMNVKQFSYFFHKYIGVRPIDYVIQHRMERAGELLRGGTYPIRDVAFSVGYANSLYFSRLFRKRFGVSPSEYRNDK